MIKAPKNKYLKGWLIYDAIGKKDRCLVDEFGLVFLKGSKEFPGTGGWRQYDDSSYCRLKILPNPVKKGNEFNDSSWSWEGWYSYNWKCDSWAWIYGER